ERSLLTKKTHFPAQVLSRRSVRRMHQEQGRAQLGGCRAPHGGTVIGRRDAFGLVSVPASEPQRRPMLSCRRTGSFTFLLAPTLPHRRTPGGGRQAFLRFRAAASAVSRLRQRRGGGRLWPPSLNAMRETPDPHSVCRQMTARAAQGMPRRKHVVPNSLWTSGRSARGRSNGMST